MMPSRMKLEVLSRYYLKFDHGALTLDPSHPWEDQPPPGVELWSCLPAALGESVLSSAIKRLSACVCKL